MSGLKFIIRFWLLVVVMTSVCSCATVLESYTPEQKLSAERIVIKRQVDLRGNTLSLPEGCTLVFKKGGLISNGTIEGSDTRIKYKGPCFDGVIIKGTWNIPNIRSEMFLSYDKTNLTNLFKLQNGSIKNRIYVAPGLYYVNSNVQRAALPLTSNTTLILDGDIMLEEQTNNQYY